LASLPRLDRSERKRLEPIPGQPPNLLRLPPGCAFAPRCAYRMPICDQPVPLYDFGASHVARCYLYDERARDQRPEAMRELPTIPAGS
jgi:oligopeptide/dipeptide ABC transporter ATP-binding protein